MQPIFIIDLLFKKAPRKKTKEKYTVLYREIIVSIQIFSKLLLLKPLFDNLQTTNLSLEELNLENEPSIEKNILFIALKLVVFSHVNLVSLNSFCLLFN